MSSAPPTPPYHTPSPPPQSPPPALPPSPQPSPNTPTRADPVPPPSPVSASWEAGVEGPPTAPLRRPATRRPYVRHPKPPQSYVELIGEALESSPSGALTLAGITHYLRRRYPFFRGNYQGWRNSVRHNLSLNQCFKKILRDPRRPFGKDNLWTLDPRHLPRSSAKRPAPPPAAPPCSNQSGRSEARETLGRGSQSSGSTVLNEGHTSPVTRSKDLNHDSREPADGGLRGLNSDKQVDGDGSFWRTLSLQRDGPDDNSKGFNRGRTSPPSPPRLSTAPPPHFLDIIFTRSSLSSDLGGFRTTLTSPSLGHALLPSAPHPLHPLLSPQPFTPPSSAARAFPTSYTPVPSTSRPPFLSSVGNVLAANLIPKAIEASSPREQCGEERGRERYGEGSVFPLGETVSGDGQKTASLHLDNCPAPLRPLPARGNEVEPAPHPTSRPQAGQDSHSHTFTASPLNLRSSSRLKFGIEEILCWGVGVRGADP